MKLFKIMIIPVIVIFFLSSCKDLSNNIPENLADTQTVKNVHNSIPFDPVTNTFNFDNFTTNFSDGDCFGICMFEKCAFNGTLKTYCKQFDNMDIKESLYDYTIDDSAFDDNKKINIDKINDNDCIKIINCIIELQTNQRSYYKRLNFSLHDIIEELNADSPVILILQYKNNSHAVLAYGYKKDKNNDKAINLLIADPNKRTKLTDEIENSIKVVNVDSKLVFSYQNNSDIIIDEARLNKL